MVTRLIPVILVSLTTAAAAQSPAPTPAATTRPPAAAPGEEPAGFSYHAEGRRDPFVSLLRRGTQTQKAPAGSRPAGLAGLGAGEVTLKGTMQGRDGYVAIVLGADTRTYIVRPGARLLDGTIHSIGAESMVILQQVNDPLSREKQREVRKLLRQTEEAR